MDADRLPTSQQRIINLLLTNGWVENGAPNRLRKANRRVCVGSKQTTFSIRTPQQDDDCHHEIYQTKDVKTIRDAI